MSGSDPDRYSAPTSSFGYYRGNPMFGGDGSGMGPNNSGVGQFAPGQGASGNPPGYPHCLYWLIGLVIVEIFLSNWLFGSL